MKSTPFVKLIAVGKGSFSLTGELTFSSVPGLWRESKRLFADATKEIVLDLEEVVRTDSAGLALMVEWLRQAKIRKITIRFQNVPKQMISLAETTEVSAFLGENTELL